MNFDFFTSIIIFVFFKICVTSSWCNHQKCDGIFWFTKIVSIYNLQMGQSAFLISCVKGSFDIVKFLELKGSDIEIDTLVSHAAELYSEKVRFWISRIYIFRFVSTICIYYTYIDIVTNWDMYVTFIQLTWLITINLEMHLSIHLYIVCDL